MGDHSALARERPVLEPHELLAAVTQQHHHKVHRMHLAVTAAELLVTEVDLGIHARRRLGKSLIDPLILRHLRQVVLAADFHHVVVHRPGRHLREVRMAFLQPVVHLGGGSVLELTEALDDEVPVGFQDEWFVCDVLRERFELGPVHLQVLLHCPEVQTQMVGNPLD